MPSVKSELLAALAASLETLLPGAGTHAALESPKVAAHGDFASTAAMQLAKPLKSNPRQVAEQLRALLLAQPAFVHWVAQIDIAGPGFINLRLHSAAKQSVVQGILQAKEGFVYLHIGVASAMAVVFVAVLLVLLLVQTKVLEKQVHYA